MTGLTIPIIFIISTLVLFLPRNKALPLYIVGFTLIPIGAALIIGPASFYPIRILTFFGCVRILVIKREKIGNCFNGLDKLMLTLVILLIITGLLQPKNEDSTIITRLGEVYDTAGSYFVFRHLIKSKDDILLAFKTVAILFIILFVFMSYERVMNNNLFSLLGGVPPCPEIREGRLRCQGPFKHSILAGTFPATTLAWCAILCLEKKVNKILVYGGTLCGLGIIFLSASSGPIMSFLFVIVGLLFWFQRYKMKRVQLILVLTLLILQLTMKSPVWYLISRIDLTGSSTGWHRSELIDSAIRHFSEWWLIGTTYTRHWMVTGVSWSKNHVDITNQYIRYGIDGGFFAILLFVLMIRKGFQYIGKNILVLPEQEFKTKILVWVLGASLFSHCVTFFSVRYFDQNMTYYFMLLAMIANFSETTNYSTQNEEDIKEVT